MLVIDMAVPLLFGWPPISMVFAANIITLPRPGVRLFMLPIDIY